MLEQESFTSLSPYTDHARAGSWCCCRTAEFDLYGASKTAN